MCGDIRKGIKQPCTCRTKGICARFANWLLAKQDRDEGWSTGNRWCREDRKFTGARVRGRGGPITHDMQLALTRPTTSIVLPCFSLFLILSLILLSLLWGVLSLRNFSLFRLKASPQSTRHTLTERSNFQSLWQRNRGSLQWAEKS